MLMHCEKDSALIANFGQNYHHTMKNLVKQLRKSFLLGKFGSERVMALSKITVKILLQVSHKK